MCDNYNWIFFYFGQENLNISQINMYSITVIIRYVKPFDHNTHIQQALFMLTLSAFYVIVTMFVFHAQC